MASKGAQPYSRCVFINCPFDSDYKPILDAIGFAIHDCGFIARISLEDAGTGRGRITKICQIIRESQYSIHDLCRIESPRLNMAFEAGVFYGAMTYGGGKHASKDMLVLDSVKYRPQKTMSDISGQDGGTHYDDPFKAIRCVRSFLARKSGRTDMPGHTQIGKRYRACLAALPKMARDTKRSWKEINSFEYFPELLFLMTDWLRLHP